MLRFVLSLLFWVLMKPLEQLDLGLAFAKMRQIDSGMSD